MRLPTTHNRSTARVITGARARLVAFVACVAALAVPPAIAQDVVIPPAPTAKPAQAGPDDVRIDLDRFGVGDRARPGEWCGIRVRFQDTAASQRTIIVRLELRDSDGDHPVYERVLTSNPGVLQTAWLYARLPFSFDPDSRDRGMTALVYDAPEDDGATPSGPTGYRVGRLLGRAVLQPTVRQVLFPGEGQLVVIGSARYGLEKYGQRAGERDQFPPLRHELTNSDAALKSVDELPDRWQGLAPVETIVWGSGEPADLRGERAAAVREWVNRGGHLVIILPPVGQTWTNPASNELYPILPVVSVQRREGVNLAAYRHLLTTDRNAVLPGDAIVHVLKPNVDAQAGEAMRILAGPDGGCVVARRLVGLGAVTLVGLDLSARPFAGGRSLDPKVFWHRVLGKRGSFASEQDLASGGGGARTVVSFDRDVRELITDQGKSAAGVLLGFVVFAAYWLCAGPLGFLYLKRRGLTRHAWIAFALTTAAFTAVAWGGATLLRPKRVDGRHLTFIDHVYGQGTQRTRTWASIMIPRYGEASIRAGEAQDRERTRAANLVAAWDSPVTLDDRSFPDARSYAIDARTPDTIRVPTRATVKEVVADWAGGPIWRMPAPLDRTDAAGVRLVRDPSDASASEATRLVGVLAHDLPGDLTDVTIVVVRRFVAMGPNAPEFTAIGSAYGYSRWKPGEASALDLSTLQLTSGGERRLGTALDVYLTDLAKSGGDGIIGSDEAAAAKAPERLKALAFFGMLRPPEDAKASSNPTAAQWPIAAQRPASMGWDLSRWFSQPCLIIVGFVEGQQPTPLFVDDEAVSLKGRTVVRWVYPLQDQAPELVPPAGQ